MEKKIKYRIGCDLAYRPNWVIRQLQKIGLYINYGGDFCVVYRIHEDGTSELISHTKRKIRPDRKLYISLWSNLK